MNISIIGTGYVGLVTGVCMASMGLNVTCCDTDKEKIDRLREGILPIYEPSLDILFNKCVKQKDRLVFTNDMELAVDRSEVIFITVNTPIREDNTCDLSNVFEVVREIAKHMNDYKVIVNKSTVPVGTGRKAKEEIRKVLRERDVRLAFDIVSNPEFLKEGSAVYDFINAERIVIGVEDGPAADLVKEVYQDQILCGTPVVTTSLETAEMIKYASNAYLAAKISFINEIAGICELYHADVAEVAHGMGLDGRIGRDFLRPGPGFGGSCFPKDLRALAGLAENAGYEPLILNSVLERNKRQTEKMVEKISKAADGLEGRRIAVLGLAFKPGTDDIRDSPALSVISKLLDQEALVNVYDPKAMENVKQAHPGLKVKYCRDAYSACAHSECIVLVTDWPEFASLDFKRLKKLVGKPVFLDLRNLCEPSLLKEHGFYYEGVGRI